MVELGLCRLFWEAGLAIGLSFILGLAVGLFTMSYVSRHRRSKEKHEIRSSS
jgi:hypothetical protein